MAAYPGAAGSIVQVNSNNGPYILAPGDGIHLFGLPPSGQTQKPALDSNVTFETVTVGEASIATTRESMEGGNPPAVSLMIIFNGNPGTFEIDLQEAEVDADAFYITPSNAAYKITSATQVGTYYIATTDLIPTGGKFLRAKVVALGNAVGLIAKLVQLA